MCGGVREHYVQVRDPSGTTTWQSATLAPEVAFVDVPDSALQAEGIHTAILFTVNVLGFVQELWAEVLNDMSVPELATLQVSRLTVKDTVVKMEAFLAPEAEASHIMCVPQTAEMGAGSIEVGWALALDSVSSIAVASMTVQPEPVDPTTIAADGWTSWD